MLYSRDHLPHSALELTSKPHIVLIEEADVIDLVAEAQQRRSMPNKSPASAGFGIATDVLEHLYGCTGRNASKFEPLFAHRAGPSRPEKSIS